MLPIFVVILILPYMYLKKPKIMKPFNRILKKESILSLCSVQPQHNATNQAFFGKRAFT